MISIDLATEEPTPLKEDQMGNGNKLAPIALLFSQILKKKFNKEVIFSIEYSPNWLTTVPIKEELSENWELIQEVYSSLVDDKYKLEKQIELIKRNGNQYFDIWFHEPYSFAVEFDESQHFNQFRFRTLNFYEKFSNGFNISDYQLFTQAFKKPGKSGFQKLKSYDPLFPEIYEGEAQDNRIRQRAFRDFLKDIIPVSRGFNPTVRIPFQVVNEKISNFNTTDLEKIKQYVNDNELLRRINVL